MARYSPIKIINTPEIPQRRYLNLKYPEIEVEFSDIYVYTTLSDRYDKLSQVYYNDSSLWWIISRANISRNDCGWNNTTNSIYHQCAVICEH